MREVLAAAAAIEGWFCRWFDRDYSCCRCTIHSVLLVLLTAASRLGSIHDACRR